MRVALVATSDLGGGAARAGHRLHRALRDQGVESRMLVRTRLSDDPDVHEDRGPLAQRIGYPLLEPRLQRVQRTLNPVQHSMNVLPTRWHSHPLVTSADVVNLQWIGMGAMSVRDVARIPRPTLLTLHDMWAFCGSEHYAEEGPTARWLAGYNKRNRPHGHGGIDVDRWTWKRKQRWPRMSVVCPSRWLADCVRASSLMRDWPVTVIPYPLDLEVFQPRDRRQARELLDLPVDGDVVVFGADRAATDPRKGYDVLADALHLVRGRRDVTTVVFGQSRPPSDQDASTRWLGRVQDDRVLSLIYSAADVVVVPSRQDNLPQTATEAQACGTPVVAFNTTGLADTVDAGRTGLLAEPFSAEDLARCVLEVLEHDDRGRMGSLARERAVRLWTGQTIAQQYVDAYAEARDLAARFASGQT